MTLQFPTFDSTPEEIEAFLNDLERDGLPPGSRRFTIWLSALFDQLEDYSAARQEALSEAEATLDRLASLISTLEGNS